MKNLCLCVLLLLGMRAEGQIVLNEHKYPAVVTGTDSIKMSTTYCYFPPLTPMSGGLRDFGVLADSIPVFRDYRIPSTTYEFADSNEFFLLRYKYNGNVQSSITSSGIMEYDRDISPISYNISPLTGAFFDSLFIPAQTAHYSAQRTRIGFPATMGDVWVSGYGYDVGFELSTALPAYSHAPGVVKSKVIEQSVVVGWGKIMVNDAGGFLTLYLDALQVQHVTIKQDSFFLNSALMPETLLTLFGLYQGKTDTTYEQEYLRQGEVTPLISILCKDAAYTHPIRARRHVQRLDVYVDGVDDAATFKASVFPNPVTDELVHITATSGTYDYTVTDVLGRSITRGKVEIIDRQGIIKLPEDIMPGYYYLHIAAANKKQTIPLQISR